MARGITYPIHGTYETIIGPGCVLFGKVISYGGSDYIRQDIRDEELRERALGHALRHCGPSTSENEVIAVAKAFEAYLGGETDG